MKARLNSKVLNGLCQKQEQVGVEIERDPLQLRMIDWGSAIQGIKTKDLGISCLEMKVETLEMEVMNPRENRFRDKCHRGSPGEQLRLMVERRRRTRESKRG